MPSAMGLRMHNLVPKLFGLCYVSGIVSLSLYLSPWIVFFRTCSCDVFSWSRLISDAVSSVSDLFLESGKSIPRSLSDDNHVWIWYSLSYLLPAALKNVAYSLSMFYRCLRFRILIGIGYFFGGLKLAELTWVHWGSKIFFSYSKKQ